ncbi:MAG: transcription termination/antitermination protein NusG [Oscillospiraceae bacterium]|jgi:transcriptional antiterminator NusG|nr:transcription termination/antitermination protein NusG [Oscillospiraceae bacterium]
MNEKARWYVIHTYSGYERKVEESIKKAALNRGMTDLILEMHIPSEMVTDSDAAGKAKEPKKRLLFPGYVYIHMILTDQSWHLVRNVRGVTGFISEANKPVPLTLEEIESLGMERKEVVVTGYKIGDTVEMIDGPLEGSDGIIFEINPEDFTVKLKVDMFGKDVEVELELDQIKAI